MILLSWHTFPLTYVSSLVKPQQKPTSTAPPFHGLKSHSNTVSVNVYENYKESLCDRFQFGAHWRDRTSSNQTYNIREISCSLITTLTLQML